MEDCEELNEYGKEIFMKAREIVNQYNMDDSDPMTDYFHVHFTKIIRFPTISQSKHPNF